MLSLRGKEIVTRIQDLFQPWMILVFGLSDALPTMKGLNLLFFFFAASIQGGRPMEKMQSREQSWHWLGSKLFVCRKEVIQLLICPLRRKRTCTIIMEYRVLRTCSYSRTALAHNCRSTTPVLICGQLWTVPLQSSHYLRSAEPESTYQTAK